MTTQDAYEAIRAYFTRKGARIAYGEITHDDGLTEASCVYSGVADDGVELHCAVGCLLPPALYSKKFETKGLHSLLNDGRIRAYFAGVNTAFLADAQSAHDDQAADGLDGLGNVPGFIARLDELAERYGLEPVTKSVPA